MDCAETCAQRRFSHTTKRVPEAPTGFCLSPSLASQGMPSPDLKLRPEVACVRLAARQHGCITRDQAIARGMSEHGLYRAVSKGTMERLFPGVYRVVAAEASWRQRLAAASLYVGEHGAVSHRSAAALHSIARGSGPIALRCQPRGRSDRDET